MQIVINVDNELYEYFSKRRTMHDDGYFSHIGKLIKALRDGTPLPKGHGRIADMDEAIKCIKDVEGKDAIWATSLIEWACSKRTIIEADRESEK